MTICLSVAAVNATPRHNTKERYFDGPPKRHRHTTRKAVAKAALITATIVGNAAIDELKKSRTNR